MALYFQWKRDKGKSAYSGAWSQFSTLVKWNHGSRSETQMLFQLKSVGAREPWCLRKRNRLVIAEGGENKWDSIFSSKQCHKNCSAGAWDLLPAAPVSPALCLGFVQLQLHIIWRKVGKSFLCSFCLLGEIITTRVGRSNVKAFLPMWHFCITGTTHSPCLGRNTMFWWTEAEKKWRSCIWDGSAQAIYPLFNHMLNFCPSAFTYSCVESGLPLETRLWSRLVTGQKNKLAAWKLSPAAVTRRFAIKLNELHLRPEEGLLWPQRPLLSSSLTSFP